MQKANIVFFSSFFLSARLVLIFEENEKFYML